MAMLQQLIATPSMSSVSPEFDISNRAVINLLANWLEDLGFVVEVTPLPKQPDKANLLARLGELRPDSQGLMLAGHTDTVPYDAHHWHHDPFKLTEAQQRLYGLGTADMKAFFALVIAAIQTLDSTQLTQPVFLLATADEESSMQGAELLVAQGCPNVRYAVIGEPTGLQPVNMHKGIMMEAIRLTGQGGHSSDPTLGASALEAMHAVMGDILQWRQELQQRYHDDRFHVPVPTLNLGYIHGGDNPNRICAECELHIDLRPLPGMDLGELRQQLQQRLQRRFRQTKIAWQVAPLFHGTPPFHTPASATLVKAAEAITCQHSSATAFCTEAPYLSELGIETIILGPGDIAQAHQPDEFIAMQNLQPMISIIQALIKKFCM